MIWRVEPAEFNSAHWQCRIYMVDGPLQSNPILYDLMKEYSKNIWAWRFLHSFVALICIDYYDWSNSQEKHIWQWRTKLQTSWKHDRTRSIGSCQIFVISSQQTLSLWPSMLCIGVRAYCTPAKSTASIGARRLLYHVAWLPRCLGSRSECLAASKGPWKNYGSCSFYRLRDGQLSLRWGWIWSTKRLRPKGFWMLLDHVLEFPNSMNLVKRSWHEGILHWARWPKWLAEVWWRCPTRAKILPVAFSAACLLWNHLWQEHWDAFSVNISQL